MANRRFNPLDPLGLFERGGNPSQSSDLEAKLERKRRLEPILDRAIEEIKKAIPDEADAHKTYNALANMLDKANMLDNLDLPTDRDIVRGISHDEESHGHILTAMLARLMNIRQSL